LTAAALGLSPTVRFTGDLGDITGEWRHHILALFRANIARHADASRTDIEVEVGQTIMMRVGRRHRLRSCPPALRGGVRNVTQRADALGGSLLIRSRPGNGTLVDASCRCLRRIFPGGRNPPPLGRDLWAHGRRWTNSPTLGLVWSG